MRIRTNKLLLACLLTCSNLASAQAWNLPQDLNDKNTKVSFEVDSTWHLVKGKTSQVKGHVNLRDAQDPNSIQGELILPVNKFDTDNSSRDNKMRDVMAEKTFKEVHLIISEVQNLPSPSEVQKSAAQVLLVGSLSIRGITREVKMPAQLSYHKGIYRVSGKFKFPWSAFGVEDPSILVAKVYPDVLINFKLDLI